MGTVSSLLFRVVERIIGALQPTLDRLIFEQGGDAGGSEWRRRARERRGAPARGDWVSPLDECGPTGRRANRRSRGRGRAALRRRS